MPLNEASRWRTRDCAESAYQQRARCCRDDRALFRWSLVLPGNQLRLVGPSKLEANSLLGNQMIRRGITVAAFAIAGLASVIAWASIDSRICKAFSRLCAPRSDECGGGLDVCAVTAQTWLDLTLYLVGPPLGFAVLGYLLAERKSRYLVMLKCLVFAVVAHWLLTFAGTRVLHI